MALNAKIQIKIYNQHLEQKKAGEEQKLHICKICVHRGTRAGVLSNKKKKKNEHMKYFLYTGLLTLSQNFISMMIR